ncbi:MAG: hypothetical protein AB7F88_06620 [Pyrinomonadaceae bacterium]
MTTLLGEFKSVTESLNAAGIEYAVCGGWAMAIHGHTRSTKDIDLLILSKDMGEILRILSEIGYDIEGLPLHFDVEIRRVSKIGGEPKRLITVDLLLVNDLLMGVWENRELQKWAEGTTSVVSRDGLIKMKLLAGRKQDILDIETLREAEDEG